MFELIIRSPKGDVLAGVFDTLTRAMAEASDWPPPKNGLIVVRDQNGRQEVIVAAPAIGIH